MSEHYNEALQQVVVAEYMDMIAARQAEPARLEDKARRLKDIELVEARAEIARLREALEKYADDDHWDWQCAGDGHADGVCDLGPFLAAKALETAP